MEAVNSKPTLGLLVKWKRNEAWEWGVWLLAPINFLRAPYRSFRNEDVWMEVGISFSIQR